jgi:hypothetical protein
MHEKLLWFNPNLQYVFNSNIVEYDMNAMSVSISEKYGLLDKEIINQLKLLPKEDRTVKMGLLQRADPEFSKKLLECELDTRNKFLELNHLDESNVLSLHNDACIFISRKKIVSNIEGVKFKHSNTWSSYINLKGVELFYADGAIEYKNIPKEMLMKHTLGFNKFFCKVFEKMEDNDPSILSYLSKFQTKYLQDKLPQYYYFPFGKLGDYKTYNLEITSYIANMVLKEMKGW